MRFSIIIPAYNRAHLIGQTLNSLVNQSFDANLYEILVCDNNSTDNTKDVVESLISNERNVIVRYLQERRQGVHFARNSTALKASGRYLYFTDDDMIADSNMLEEFNKWIKIFPEVKVFGGKVLPKWQTTPPPWITKYFSDSTLSLTNRSEYISIGNADPGIASCHQLICRFAFIKAGGFRPEYTKDEWLGDGETGLNREISRLGYLFGFFSSTVTHHCIPPNRTTMNYICKRFKNQGQADAFTHYRQFVPNSRILLKLFIKHCIFSWKENILSICLKLYGKENWRLCAANAYLEKGFSCYIRRLLKSHELRAIATKESYLD